MYTQQISIKVNDESKLEEAYSAFDFLVHTYITNSQIWGREWPIYVQGDTIIAVVKSPEEDSLTAYSSKYLPMRLEHLKELCGNNIEIKLLGKEYAPEPVCACAKSDYYFLITHWQSVEPPVKCGTCLSTVPLYKVQGFNEEANDNLHYWDENFKACEALLMHGDVGGEFSLDETNNVASPLSVMGREVCSEIEKRSNTTTYYFLPNNVESTVDNELDSLCPSCGGQWLVTQPLPNNIFNYKCDNCRLVSTFSTNIQG
jgi:predicted  nucleic acid-binding Zn ribbon protein